MRTKLIQDSSDFLADKDLQPEGLIVSSGMTEYELIEVLFGLTRDANKRVKNRAAKLISHLSQMNPGAVGVHNEHVLSMITAGDNILR